MLARENILNTAARADASAVVIARPQNVAVAIFILQTVEIVVYAVPRN